MRKVFARPEKSILLPKSVQAVLVVKNLPAMRETWLWYLGWEDPLEIGYPLQSSGLENSMDCVSTWSQRVRHDWKTFTLLLSQLSHKGSPRTLEWVAYPFSSRYSWPRNYSSVSCIPRGFFTNWAIREVYQKTNMEASLINCVFFWCSVRVKLDPWINWII